MHCSTSVPMTICSPTRSWVPLSKDLQWRTILASANGYEPSFYRTGAGAEIDLVLRSGRAMAFELKSSTVPKVPKGFWNALEDISPDEAYVVAPVERFYPLKHGVTVAPLIDIIAKLNKDL